MKLNFEGSLSGSDLYKASRLVPQSSAIGQQPFPHSMFSWPIDKTLGFSLILIFIGVFVIISARGIEEPFEVVPILVGASFFCGLVVALGNMKLPKSRSIRERPYPLRALYKPYGATISGLCLFMAGISLIPERDEQGNIVLLLSAIYLVCGILLLVAAFQQRWMNFEFRVSTSVGEKVQGKISDQGLEIEAPAWNGKWGWSAFIGCGLSKTMVFLYTCPHHGYIIPKRFFRSEADWQSFLSEVENKL